MLLQRTFASVACLVLLTATGSSQTPEVLSWQSDLDAARAAAERENKLLLVHFYTDSCGPCRVLDATVFNQPSVASAVQTHYVPVKLNASEFPATAQRFGITRVPTDVLITPQGQVIDRVVSPTTPMAYISRMTSVAEQHKHQAGRSFPVAANNFGTTQPVNSAYASLAVPTEQASDAGASTTPQPAVETQTAPAAVTLNPYANAANAQLPVAKQPAASDTQATMAASAPNASVVENQYSNTPVTPIQPTQQTPAQPALAGVQSSALATASSELELPAGSPPLGFFGYCPVTMKKENRWQKGSTEWGAYHRGRTYLFASAECRDAFIKDSTSADTFAPALSGIDPVAAIDQREMKLGLQKYGVEYAGMFYLFSSEDNLRKFWSNADRYASGVQQAMQAAPAGRLIR